MTRQDYMQHRVTHRQYYAEIARLAGIKFEPNHSVVVRAKRSTDEHYNDIPLLVWDRLGYLARAGLTRAFKECEDCYSMAGACCAMKEAVRQAVERQETTV